MTVSNSTDTNQASEELINAFIKKWAGDHAAHLLDNDDNDGERLRQAIEGLIRTEKLKLLDEVIHQSTVNLKSAKAVAGWAELRKELLEAEL